MVKTIEMIQESNSLKNPELTLKNWTVNIEEDSETGDLILPLPQEILNLQGWQEGDVLDWEDNQNGSWSLTKKVYNSNMNNKEKEILDITQEECAEVIVAISKISRFGLDNVKPGKPLTNRQHLAEELGDLQAMIDLCIDYNLVDKKEVLVAADNKIAKLKKWSNIFKSEIKL
jgi:NTP pyrophosphatase (non-canonical NTP hydrolase)